MKCLKKSGFRVIAFTLCCTILLSTVNTVALTPLKEDPNWQAKHSTWTPEEAAIDIPNTVGDLTNEQLQTAILSSEDTPEIVPIESIVETKSVHRLWEQEPNDNTIIFQNKDGSKTAYFYSRPVKYTDANGKKHDKRSTLVNTVNNAKYTKDYGYVNAFNDIKTYYPSSINPEKGMVLETPDLTVELSPLSSTEKRYVLSDGQELTATEYVAQSGIADVAKQATTPSTDTAEIRETVRQAGAAAAQKGQIQEIGSHAKDAVLYKEVFGNKTSLRYSSTFEGFKEDIILDENTGVNEFKFCVKTNGLSLIETDEGNYCLVNPLTGKTMAAIGDLVITDSKPQPELQSVSDIKLPEETAVLPEDVSDITEVQYEHHYEAQTVTPDQEYILTVVVDETYLNDPATVYPVYVDPTMTVMGSGDIEDVSLYSNINYTLDSTESQQIKVGYNSPTYGTSRALFDFPILNFNTDFIFLYGNQISSARLNLYCLPQGYYNQETKTYLNPFDEAKQLSLYEYYSQWSPSTVNWSNTNPNNYGCLINSTSVTSGWTSFNISYVINKFKTDPNYTTNFMDRGLMLKADSETSTTWKKFASSEYTTTSYRPYIQITYNDNPPACPQVVSGAVYHLRNYSGDYLDVYNNDTADNTRLLQYSFTGNSNQQFKINNITGGEYEIEPQHTIGKVLSVNASNQVIIETDCNLSRQRWYIFYRNGSYHFVNKQNNTKVMEATYDSDYVSTSNNYDYCDWEVIPVGDFDDGDFDSYGYNTDYLMSLVWGSLSSIATNCVGNATISVSVIQNFFYQFGLSPTSANIIYAAGAATADEMASRMLQLANVEKSYYLGKAITDGAIIYLGTVGVFAGIDTILASAAGGIAGFLTGPGEVAIGSVSICGVISGVVTVAACAQVVGVATSSLSADLNAYNSAPNPNIKYSLTNNMKNAGMQVPSYKHAAHHIVPKNESAGGWGTKLRAKLNELGITDFDSADNGVFLPTDSTSGLEATIHSGRHPFEYVKRLYLRLENVTTQSEALQIIRQVGNELQNGVSFVKILN